MIVSYERPSLSNNHYGKGSHNMYLLTQIQKYRTGHQLSSFFLDLTDSAQIGTVAVVLYTKYNPLKPMFFPDFLTFDVRVSTFEIVIETLNMVFVENKQASFHNPYRTRSLNAFFKHF